MMEVNETCGLEVIDTISKYVNNVQIEVLTNSQWGGAIREEAIIIWNFISNHIKTLNRIKYTGYSYLIHLKLEEPLK